MVHARETIRNSPSTCVLENPQALRKTFIRPTYKYSKMICSSFKLVVSPFDWKKRENLSAEYVDVVRPGQQLRILIAAWGEQLRILIAAWGSARTGSSFFNLVGRGLARPIIF